MKGLAHESKLFAEDGKDIKVRSQPYEYYLVGGEKVDFIHVSIRLLAGRSADQKRMLSLHTQSKLKRLNLERASKIANDILHKVGDTQNDQQIFV